MKIRLLFLLICLSAPAFGQGKITLIDKNTKEPIPGVQVNIQGLSPLLSDTKGEVLFSISKSSFANISHLAYESMGIQLQPGQELTLNLIPQIQNLSEVVVKGFESDRPLIQQAGAISRVSEQDLYRFNENSILSAFNTKPGIRIEQRAGASYRISIRGSSLRSPFGVRNVKVYWNDIPFTSPDGTTALNLLDLSNIQGSEVIRGPGGSIYGAGNGGVISFTSRQNFEGNYFSADWGIGDFGLRRFRVGLDQKLENGGISVSYVEQKSEGYRAHNASDRKVFQMAYHTKPSEKQQLSAQILYSDLFYEIPGALTPAQVAENRRQARPGSIAQNSSIKQQSLYGTLSHRIKLGRSWSNSTALYMNTSNFENPFILDYKKETSFSYGGRTKFFFDDKWGNIDIKFTAGAEYQYGKTNAQNFGNRQGKADTVRFSDDLTSTQAFIFQQLELSLTKKTLLTLGLSENFNRYDIDRTIDAGSAAPSANSKVFDPIIIPRLALSHLINAYSGIHASVSGGFSPPTIAEVRTNEGSINLDLQAERGTNWEAGYRGSRGIFNWDITAFYFKLNETITSFTNNQGVVLFRNAGSTDQKGIEASLDYLLIHSNESWLQKLKLSHAYTGHYFFFSSYNSGGNDFSGNRLTGVSPHTLVNLLDLNLKPGFYLNLSHQFTDRIPLNDANTVYQDAYHLLGARVGYKKLLGSRWNLETYAGVDNLLDEQYSLGNDLNAFASRFYQPAPGINWYGGIKVGMRY